MSEHEVWNELGNLYFATGMLDQASYAYNRAIKLQPQFGLPYSNLACIKLQQGDFDNAADLYKKGIELLINDRDKAISWYRLGDVFRRLKNYRDAIMAYQQADALDAEVCINLEGSLAFLYGSSNIPVDKIPSILDTPSMMDGGEVVQQSILLDNGESASIESAVMHVEEVPFVEQDPESEDTLSQQNLFDISLINSDQFRDPVEEKPDDIMPGDEIPQYTTEAFSEKSLNFAGSVAVSPATSLLEVGTAVEMTWQEEPPLQNESCFCASNSDQVDEEDMTVCEYVEDFTNVEETVKEPGVQEDDAGLNPDFYYIRKQLEKKIERLELEIKKDLRNAKKWGELANLYKSTGLYDKSIEAIQNAIRLAPNIPSYLYELGVMYGVIGKHDDAINCMEMVVGIESAHSLAHASLSGYYRKRGLIELADQHIGAAMKNYIDDENQYNLACLEALKGNAEKSVQFLRKALEGRQIQVEWVLRDPDLDAIRFTQQFKDLIVEFAH